MTDKEKSSEGQPCNHLGCLNHISHPCEGRGRVAGRPVPSPITQTLILLVIHYFDLLAINCEHKHSHDADCHHPDQDFNCMCCAPCNCPLLLEGDK